MSCSHIVVRESKGLHTGFQLFAEIVCKTIENDNMMNNFTIICDCSYRYVDSM